jgi:hypothetical protein
MNCYRHGQWSCAVQKRKFRGRYVENQGYRAFADLNRIRSLRLILNDPVIVREQELAALYDALCAFAPRRINFAARHAGTTQACWARRPSARPAAAGQANKTA